MLCIRISVYSSLKNSSYNWGFTNSPEGKINNKLELKYEKLNKIKVKIVLKNLIIF